MKQTIYTFDTFYLTLLIKIHKWQIYNLFYCYCDYHSKCLDFLHYVSWHELLTCIFISCFALTATQVLPRSLGLFKIVSELSKMGTQIRKLSPPSHRRNRREWEDIKNHSLRAFVPTFETSGTILKKTIYNQTRLQPKCRINVV